MTAPRSASPISISALAGALAATLGAGVLVGWAFDIEWLRSLAPRYIVMLPNTAVAVLAGGLSLLLLNGTASRRRLLAARVLGTVVLVIGGISLLARMFDWDLAMYRILFPAALAKYPYRPIGLMATNSTVALTLTGIALLAASSETERRRRLARRAAALGGAISGVALLGHLYGAHALYAVDQAAGMALLTALGFALLQVGVLWLYPNEGRVSLIMRDDLTGALLRPLLLLTVVVPVILGRLWITARENAVVSQETGIAVFVVLTVAWIVVLLLRTGAAIRAADEERARVLESEQQARASAEAANKAKSDFLAVVSHELRTPLNAILGYQSLLADEVLGPLSETQGQHLRRIGHSAQHLTTIVDQILTLARAEVKETAINLDTVSVDMLLREVVAIATPLAGAKGLQVHCDCDPNITIVSDAAKLRQILINLVGNAVKFTDTGSVALHARLDGADVVIEVRDTGIGIAPEHQERIFDEFWQAEQPLTRRAGGAGLGLAVSRHLATLLSGVITVTSAPGRGSTFTLRLPASVAARTAT